MPDTLLSSVAIAVINGDPCPHGAYMLVEMGGQ